MMTSQLENELGDVKHCWRICKQNIIVNSVGVDHWTYELAIIASNDLLKICSINKHHIFNIQFNR